MPDTPEAFDESAIDVYAGKLEAMKIPTPDTPYGAYIAFDMLVQLASASVVRAGHYPLDGAEILEFKPRSTP